MVFYKILLSTSKNRKIIIYIKNVPIVKNFKNTYFEVLPNNPGSLIPRFYESSFKT